ncbi:nuclear transport factor 2 family protein [Streptomyces sp. C11-1]|uniref:Nuclear transport factor 2 family protein n=1 Tax=Streptomyces durocortorensis TaxID=2811104 RepID=A0ABY9VY46_9ACTN|nr:nuclear transport factor 2 family protein [Streptomyces durocortorensis]WNF27877.1 nuclear transport factor 2 family protein [Streptomyces durocortorensis]
MTDMTGRTIGTGRLRAAVERFWAAAEAREWDAFAATLADDVVYDLPQTRERIRGKERYLRFNQEYPGDWHVRVERIVADAEGRQAAARTGFTVTGEGPEETRERPQELDAIHFFTFDAQGLITGVTDFWPESYEPPAGREHLVERY